jgi:hypothetical protein
MKIYYSPDEYQGTKFLGDMVNSLFVNDLKNSLISLEPHYVILHCKYCEDRNYATMKENCLSGGRYCSLPSRSNLKGERILMQDLHHICVEKFAKANDKLEVWGEYMFQFDRVCAPNMELTCTKKLLEKLKITE